MNKNNQSPNSRVELSRLLTRIEQNKVTDTDQSILYDVDTAKTLRLGITGMPGAGKSCLINSLLPFFRNDNKRIGVLALDPVSPKTGGTILADRVRMQSHALDDNIFIRSLKYEQSITESYSKLSLISRAFSAHNYDTVIIETVGTGQSELSIMDYVDLVIVVLPSDFGDKLQGIKSGILEIADILAVNKNDLPEAIRLYELLKTTWNFEGKLISVSANTDTNIDDLYNLIFSTFQTLDSNGIISKRRKDRARNELKTAIYNSFENIVMSSINNSSEFEEAADKILNHNALPSAIAQVFLKKYLRRPDF